MKTIKTNFETTTYTVPSAFAKKATIYGSSEHTTMKKLYEGKEDDWSIVIEKRKLGTKNENKNLTYAKMQEYIKVLTDGNKENIEEFIRIKKLSKIQRNPYKYVRDWFVSKYPEAREACNVTEEATDNAGSQLSVVL